MQIPIPITLDNVSSDKLYLNVLTIHLLQEKCVANKLHAVFMCFLKIDLTIF